MKELDNAELIISSFIENQNIIINMSKFMSNDEKKKMHDMISDIEVILENIRNHEDFGKNEDETNKILGLTEDIKKIGLWVGYEKK